MLSDSERIRSTDGILSRLSRSGMSVVASARDLGWDGIRAAITEGRLEDFFDYSATSHIVSFNLRGNPTVEWKRGARFSRFQAQPGELLITPSGADNSIRQPHANEAISCCLRPDRLQALAEQEWNSGGSTIEIVESYNRDVELWTLGQRLAARLRRRSPARDSSRRPSSRRSRSSSCGDTRRYRARMSWRRRSWPTPGFAE